MYNKVFIIGNLTRDPELRYTTSGIPVCHFTVAVNRFKRKEDSSDATSPDASIGIPNHQNKIWNRDHEPSAANQDVDFINVVAWRRTAEIVGEYLKKGRPVAVEGRLQVSSFVGRDGEKRTMTEIVADNIQMLGKREGAGEGIGSKNNEAVKVEETKTADELVEETDEIPF